MSADFIVVLLGIALIAVAFFNFKLWRAKQQLALEKREMEAAYKNAPLGLAMLDCRLRFLRVNNVLAEINGKSADYHIGREIREVVPDIAEQAEENFAEVIRTGQPKYGIVFEGETAAQPGIPRCWRESVHPIFADDGKVIGISVAVEEITEEKRLNDALRDSELRERIRSSELAAVMDAAPAAILISHDAQCLEVTGNAEAYRSLKIPAGGNFSADPRSNSKIGRFTRYGESASVPADQLPMQKAASTGKELRSVELSYHLEGSEVLHMLVNAAPLFSPEGAVEGAVGAFIDITAQKEASKLLQDEAQRKDEFLATLAHELRNPLSAIRSGLEVCRLSSGGDAQQTKCHDVMERQLSHLVRLIDDLLDVSRINSGKLGLERKIISLSEVIGNALDLTRMQIEKGRHQLKTDIGLHTIFVEGDFVRLAQVFANLLNNAAKYTPDGGSIEVLAQEVGGRVRISVRDNGIGFEQEMLPSLFNMFTQLEVGRYRRAGGIGVGLYLAKKIVELHGGKIEAKSPGHGGGSTFTVELPTSAAPNTVAEGSMPSTRAPTAPRKRILIVDDNEDAANMLGALMEIDGHEVRIVHTGQASLDEASRFLPDISFIDIGLPDTSGYIVARKMRGDKQLRETVLVALTGWGTPKDQQQSKEAGFDFHLTKPASLAEIYQILPELRKASKRGFKATETAGD